MKQKSKFRRFWNLDHRKSDGFTLVELIVVIAILAVLGGATVPAYNLYIKKARESADNQLLAAVNTAFASACVENKVDSADIAEASVQINQKTITGLASVAHKDVEIDKENMAVAFLRYMLGNETMEFKNENIKALRWSDEKDCFEMDMDNVAIPEVVFSNGEEATLTQAALNAIADSFMGDMTGDELKALMETLKTQTSDGLIDAMLGEYKGLVGTVARVFGLTTEETGAYAALSFSDSIKNVFGKETADQIIDGLKSRDDVQQQAAMDKFNNGMLLYTAMVLQDENPATVHAAVKQNYFNTDTNIVNTGGNGGAAVSAALRESVYQAYLTTDAGQAAQAAGTTKENDAAFKAYLESPQCGNDIAGIIGSMQIIDSNSDAIGDRNLINQGMTNEDASTLFDKIYG